jgi:hypothetical protein
MSSELVCFLFGVVATAFWVRTLRKGSTGLGKRRLIPFLNRDGPVNYSVRTLEFWSVMVFYGAIALGLLTLPVLSWLGYRR